ncbi:hypothetical protein PVL29_015284 [Vitis rotundifolia]|uniref:Uncharacterized protein n=1 Tax=Vitis rotundifolia TaxID=103349 RepID=A0AA38ZC57_VITRO|nr:hypothetical protein PVL29_015284 [Vitis rotundifolia]
MLSSLKIKKLKTWIKLRSQSLSVKNRLIWVQSLLTLWDIMNIRKLFDDIEENPIVENDGLEQQEEQATSELPTKTQLRSTRERQPSRRYTSDEYLLLSDEGELENCQKVLLHDEKKKK